MGGCNGGGGTGRETLFLPSTLVNYVGRVLRAFSVQPWERDFLNRFESSSRDAAISVPRGAGKTKLAAAIGCAVVDPRSSFHGGEVVSCASSFSQARLVFEDALDLLGPTIAKGGTGKSGLWRIQDSVKHSEIQHRPSKARLRCVGADPSGLHGLRPRLVIADELAVWSSTKIDRALAALRTGLGKVANSRMLAIGTRPSTEDHPFARMLSDPEILSIIYKADPDDDPLAWSTVVKANPSLRVMPALRAELRKEMRLAALDGAALASWRALRLNMGVEDCEQTNILVSADTWKSIEGDVPASGKCVWGIDTAEGTAMCGLAAFWPDTGRLDAIACYPSQPSLKERGLADGVGRLYTDCAARGELLTMGRMAPDITALCAEGLARFGRPVRVVADRERLRTLKDALHATVPTVPLVARGMGYRDGSEHVRVFRRGVLEGVVRPVVSLLLRAACASARVIYDPAGNGKLSKQSQGGRRARSRDDAIAAAILSVWAGIGSPVTAPRWSYSGVMAGSTG